eukprot:GEMP01026904.1.p1 GENE.GEMP01026904.1~~GEMP01026904.1.p1  ORF type:complete len:442 (+),score=79.66 GEMP01026904.1:108-1433(+)
MTDWSLKQNDLRANANPTNSDDAGGQTEQESGNSGTATAGEGAVATSPGPPNAPSVLLRSCTWIRESHGLFDYESHDVLFKTDNLRYACTVMRKDTSVMIQPPLSGQGSVPIEAEPLARLVMRNGKFCVDGTRTIGPSDGVRKGGKLWRVVKDVEGGHILSEGDSIKLGRFKLRVRQLAVPQGPNSPPQEALALVTPASAPRLCRTEPEDSSAEVLPCRICLLEGATPEDPLIRPCECRGTIEYVHLACLRHWIRGRLDLSESSSAYFYKPLACELCKAAYATHMYEKGGEPWAIVELPKTQPPFVVLERDSNRPDSKGAHVISLAEKKLLKLGRGHESDVRFADVSISRWHADINFDQERGFFILSDHESKFGTLVAMRNPVPLGDSAVMFQAGRSVLEFMMKGEDDEVSMEEVPVVKEEPQIPIRNSNESTSQAEPWYP